MLFLPWRRILPVRGIAGGTRSGVTNFGMLALGMATGASSLVDAPVRSAVDPADPVDTTRAPVADTPKKARRERRGAGCAGWAWVSNNVAPRITVGPERSVHVP